MVLTIGYRRKKTTCTNRCVVLSTSREPLPRVVGTQLFNRSFPREILVADVRFTQNCLDCISVSGGTIMCLSQKSV